MKKYSKYFLAIVFLSFIIPQIVFAAWWNPFSWKVFDIFKKPQTTVVSETKREANPTPQSSINQKADPKINNPDQSNKTDSAKVVSPQTTNLVSKLSNAQIIKKVKPAVVYIETDEGSGSGMIISSDGYILTNAHVVKGFTSAQVTTFDGAIYTGTVIGRDENVDLAVIKITANGLTKVSFGDSDKLQQGDVVFTLGYPFGIKGDVSFKDGTVSRKIQDSSNSYIETSAEIHPGNSGGPLVNVYGQVVGVNTATFGQAIQGIQVGETIKLAIPINIALSRIQELKGGLNVTIAPTKPQVDVQKLCADIKNEITASNNRYTELLGEYADISKIMADAMNTDGLTGIDSFKQWYQNWTNIYDQVNNKTKDLQEKAKTTYFPNANQDDLVNMNIAFMQAGIYLKGYYDASLETLRWINTNIYWDDYFRVKAKEGLDDDNAVFQKARDSYSATIKPHQNIQKNYADLLVKYKCK